MADRRAVRHGAIIGIILSFAAILQVLGLQYTAAAKVGFLTGLSAVFVPVLGAAAFRRVPSLKTAAGVLCGLAGLWLLTLGGAGNGYNPGDSIILLSAFCYALQMIVVDHYGRGLDTVVLTIIELAVTVASALLLGIVHEGPTINLSSVSLRLVLMVGILCSGVAYGLQNAAQKHATPTRTAVILLTEPVFAALFAYWFLGEAMTVSMAVGGILILAGMLLA